MSTEEQKRIEDETQRIETLELNLKVLRRYNPRIKNIITTASYVVVYQHNGRTWDKIDLEGSLFVYELKDADDDVEDTTYSRLQETPTPSARKGKNRKGKPLMESPPPMSKPATNKPKPTHRFELMVLNRSSVCYNYVQRLDRPEDIEFANDFLMFTRRFTNPDGSPEEPAEGAIPTPIVHGLWIWEEPPPSSTAGSRARIVNIVKDLARQASEENSRLNTEGENQNPSFGGEHGGSVAAEETANRIIKNATETALPMVDRNISISELFDRHRQETMLRREEHEQNYQSQEQERNYSTPLQEQEQSYGTPLSRAGNAPQMPPSQHIIPQTTSQHMPNLAAQTSYNMGQPYGISPSGPPMGLGYPMTSLQPISVSAHSQFAPSQQGIPPCPQFIPPTPVNSGFHFQQHPQQPQDLQHQQQQHPQQSSFNPQQHLQGYPRNGYHG